MQISRAVPRTSLLVFEADLLVSQPVTGNKLPLIDVHFRVRDATTPGHYNDVVFLNGVYQLIPQADASNIFTFGPQHFDSSEGSSTAVAIDVIPIRTVGMLLSNTQSPLFDQTGYKGAGFNHKQ
jgi:hypothetical protein